MREFEIKEVSLTFKWQFRRLISSLPVVGTEAFGILCKKFAPFGISASKIIADAPSNRLGDAQIMIILLDGRLGVKFSISSFEIIINELFDDDNKNIIDIAEIVFEALKTIDEDVVIGKANIRLMYHLELEPSENAKMLSEHLSLTNNNSSLSPEMAIYQINLGSESAMQSARVAVAESLVYKDSIFFDLGIDYSELGNLTEFVSKVTKDVILIFSVFELNGESLRS